MQSLLSTSLITFQDNVRYEEHIVDMFTVIVNYFFCSFCKTYVIQFFEDSVIDGFCFNFFVILGGLGNGRCS